MKLLETIAESLLDRFVWHAPISLEMQTCGESNARFEFRTRKVIVCYELADEFPISIAGTDTRYRSRLTRRRSCRRELSTWAGRWPLMRRFRCMDKGL
jgi:hypothetical protein